MRNISFSLTTKAFNERTKDVTRRVGWKHLKPGDVVMGCRKCMGIKPGEKVEKFHAIEIISNQREPLNAILKYPANETAREGFPQLTAAQFVKMFTREIGCRSNKRVNRIEFKHL